MVHLTKPPDHGSGQLVPVDGSTRDHVQGTGHFPQFLREIRQFLTAVDPDADDRIVHAAAFRFQAQFCENAGQLPLAGNQVVGPFDAGPEPGGILDGLGHGLSHGAGQVHQIFRAALGPQQGGKIDSHIGRGGEAAAPAAPAAGLVVGNEDAPVGRTLGSGQLQAGVGGVNILLKLNQIPPGMVFGQVGPNFRKAQPGRGLREPIAPVGHGLNGVAFLF